MREAAPGEEPSWALPGGALEDGELLFDGLVREVAEETGLEVTGIGRLAFVTQVDVREAGRHPGPLAHGYLITVWTFEVASWEGEAEPNDPDGLVSEVAFVPLEEALGHLGATPKSEAGLVRAYVLGEIEPGSVHAFRRHEDGRLELLASAP